VGMDLVKCDHTMGEAAWSFTREVYRALGMPETCVADLEHCRKYEYAAARGELLIRGDHGVQMPTGATDTTTGNTTVNLCVFLIASLDLLEAAPADWESELRAGYVRFGLDIKCEFSDRLGNVLFLRGAFFCDSVPGWFPAPSTILIKCGKVLTNPCKITGLDDSAVATARVAAALALNLNFPSWWPLAGAFCDVLRRCGSNGSEVAASAVIESYDYKLRYAIPDGSEGAMIDAVLGFCADRYGWSANDVADLERLIRSVNVLPAVIHDDRFLGMMADYQ